MSIECITKIDLEQEKIYYLEKCPMCLNSLPKGPWWQFEADKAYKICKGCGAGVFIRIAAA